MKSGLRDRNNGAQVALILTRWHQVSMKSGLRDRNNQVCEQYPLQGGLDVSMKSGLRDRNNSRSAVIKGFDATCLNEVRS